MQPSPTTSLFHRAGDSSRGSGLVAVLIFGALMVMLCGSILIYSRGENNTTHRHRQFLSSKNCAESIAEYGFYQVRKVAESSSDFNVKNDIFLPGKSKAPTLPDLSKFADTGLVASGANAPELVVGYINIVKNSGNLYYVDPSDANNAYDPLRGKYVFRRDVGVYSKATVTTINGAPITTYMTETISVRGAPLFAHAIFYNMDLELLPGPDMDVYGPVHANGDLYFGSQSSSNHLSFHSIVSCSGDIFHTWKSNQNGARGGNSTTDFGQETLGSGSVTIDTPAGASVGMKTSAGWQDSTLGASDSLAYDYSKTLYDYQKALHDAATAKKDTFRTKATDMWKGNLMTKAHDVQPYTPVAIGEYKEDTTYSDGVDQSVNSGRRLIEPALPNTDANYNAAVEEQKYAANAGIYVKVNPTTGAITAESRVKTKLGESTPLTIPSGNGIFKWVPYSETKTVSTTTKTSEKISKGNYTNYTTVTSYDVVTTNSGTTSTEPVTTTTKKTEQSKAVTADPVESTADKGYSGMYDQRRTSGVDLVQIDMTALKSAVAEMQKQESLRDTTKALGGLDPADWTGIVYVEILGGAKTANDGSTIAGTAPASKTGVRIVNGTGKVPSYEAGANAEKGLTIATNTALYLKGHYNADGSISSSAGSNSATDYETGEVPAALVGDSFTVLSSSWDDTKSRDTDKPATSANTEIAAAVLAGFMPTNKDGLNKYSGGAHNFIRFLEDHSGTVAIRGSIVALFEARMNPGTWKLSVYGPPTRQWGFSRQFAEGTFPPGTPKVISYRRVNFTTMDPVSWNSAVSALKGK